MSLDVDVSAQHIRSPVSREGLAAIARATLRYERTRNALVSIALVNRATIAKLNRGHLGHSGPTDVISFGFSRATADDPVIGDIYICPDVARDNAKAHRSSVREEMARLVVHGILHVLGYDHPEDETRETSEMWQRQERLLRRLAAPTTPRVRR